MYVNKYRYFEFIFLFRIYKFGSVYRNINDIFFLVLYLVII